jgi:peptidoglycan/xylan/chitin deacetylase (PgdA/CDA1 family)
MATAHPTSNAAVSASRQLLRHAQQGAAAWAAALLGDGLACRPQHDFGILMYHRIAEPIPGQPLPTWNVTPTRLRQQLRGLLKRGFQAWPLRKVLEYRQRKLALPKRVFVVTFDDGYENNFTQALPILRELNVPATIFLATGYLGSPEPLPFDDWAAKGSPDVPPDAWRALSLDQCRQMQASGLIELAGHTHTHQDFRGRRDAFRDDLRQCRSFLRDQFSLTDATFAFPYGTKKLGFSGPAMACVVLEAGFLCSLTTEWELACLEDSPYDWGRFTAEQSDSAATLAGKLTGWFSLLRHGTQTLKNALPRRATPNAGVAGDSLTPLKPSH